MKQRRTAVFQSTTDQAGRYEIERVEPGQYRVIADRSGFVSQTYGDRRAQRGGGVTVNLAAGQTLESVDFKLTPHSVIVGKITDEDRDPIDEASVDCLRYSYSGGKRRLMSAGHATTNDLGEYRMFDLAPGKCYIKASRLTSNESEPAPVSNGKPEEEFAPSYYVNSTSLESAAQVVATAGKVVQGVNLTLQKTRAYRIRGRVISARSGKPALDAQIMLMPNASNSLLWDMERDAQVQDAKGTWEIQGVVPGSYILIGERSGDGTEREAARKPIEVDNTNVEKVELTLDPGIELRGRLLMEESSNRKGPPLNVYLQPRDATGYGLGSISGQVSEDGTFKLSGVTQDSYSVHVGVLPENCYVESVRLGSDDVTYTGLEFTEALAAEELNVTISTKGAQLEGAVVNAAQEPAPGAVVVLVPEAPRRDQTLLFKTANTDQAGHYTLKGIAPGAYKAFAWEAVEQSSYEDPEFLKAYENNGESVLLQEGAHENKILRVIPAAKEDGDS